MAKINILEPSVFNKIAAGEVVERPASVVKELIENSIDAGAKNIDVEIVDGGISFIQVVDDGQGIESGEIRKAFLPHATSKVKTAEDLENIFTLGFRGEALASIASVSEVQIISKTAEEESATFLEIDGGDFVSQKQVGAPNGTQIAVKNLFFNIPVRRKFLKKPKQEENAVSEIVSRLIMANPCVAFTYICDEKIVFQSSGTGPEDALYAVYGSNVLKNLIPISGISGETEINGFICKPNFAKPNTTYQNIVVNGRYVNSKLLSTAIGRVYEDYLMTRTYPMFLIYINIPIDEIDVNVHPNKLEIKFRDSQAIFGAINHIVDHALMEFKKQSLSEEVTRQTVTPMQNYSQNENANSTSSTDNIIFKWPETTSQPSSSVAQGGEIELSEIVLQNQQNSQKQTTNPNEQFFYQPMDDPIKLREQKALALDPEATPEPVFQKFLFEGFSKNFALLSIKVIGKIFNTFILVEIEDKVYVIDQHAAHERILYDKLLEAIDHNEFCGQMLLVPEILETNNAEHQFVMDNISNLRTIGFEIDEFGNNSFKICTIPRYLPNLSVNDFFNEILNDLNTILNLQTKDLVVERLAQTVCKHAVKGGDDLTNEEIINLLETLAREEPQLQCPHGRPFVVELKRYDVDKWFKRVV